MKSVYDDDQELLKRLAAAELKIPQEIIMKMRFAEREKGERYERTIAFFEMFEGKILERVLAFKNDLRKNEPLTFMEIIRRLEGQQFKLIRNAYVSHFGSWVFTFEIKIRGYWRYERNDNWDQCSSFRFNPYSMYTQTFNDLVELDPSIKYCGFVFKRFVELHTFMEYISIYRKHPELEMYSKAGIEHLITDSRFKNKCDKDKNFFKYFLDNKAAISKWQYSYPNILQAYKARKDIEIFYEEKQFKSCGGFVGNESILTDKVIAEIIKRGYNFHDYFDYFNAAKHFIYMDTPKILYPEDLKQAHDYYVSLYQKEEKSVLKKEFSEVAKQWEWLNYSDKEFSIFIPDDVGLLVDEGQSLHHCVGKMGYDKRMIEGGNLILFLRAKGNINSPYFTIEFDKDQKKCVQIRGDHNDSATPEVIKFVDKWVRKIKRENGEMKLSLQTA